MGFLEFLIVSILALVILFFVVFKLVFVKEKTAIIVLKFKGFNRVLMSKDGHKLREDWEIVEDPEYKKPFFGGLKILGIRGIYTVHKRDFSWIKALPNKKLEEREENGLDFIFAKVDYQYGVIVEDAEDKDLLPLTVKMILTARIVNPYKAIFKVQNWFDATSSRIIGYIREDISCYSYEEIVVRNDVLPAKQVMERLKEGGGNSIIKILKEDYGVEVVALETAKIDPPEEYRKSTLQRWQASRDAEKRMKFPMALMSAIAHQTNKSSEDIRGEFSNNPKKAFEKYKELIKMNKDYFEQELAAAAGSDSSLHRYIFKGGKGGMDIIALLGDVLQGKGPKNLEAKPQKKEENSETKPQEKENMTAQERIEKWWEGRREK